MAAHSTQGGQQGIALLAAMVLVLIVSVLGMTLLNLAGQEAMSAGAGNQAAVAQQLADAAGELAVTWFHNPQSITGIPQIALLRQKRSQEVEGAPSFFDRSGRSQFVGTVDQPDFRLHTGNPADEEVLNDPDRGLFKTMHHLGHVEEMKLYAPSKPGLLCTVEATVIPHAHPPMKQSVRMQLSALNLSPLRAAVQVKQHLGLPQQGRESRVNVHWGDLKVGEDLVLRRAEEIPTKSALALISNQSYDDVSQREDRWMEAWVGGDIHTTLPPSGVISSLPHNAHHSQSPIPGIRFDQWTYEQLKRLAKQFGHYYAIDRQGLLYPQGVVEPGHGLAPDDVMRSLTSGDQRGLIFIDTLDQTAPRGDNLGVITLRAPYFEGTVVMQGHIVLAPGGPGQSIQVLSPPQTVGATQSTRSSLQLTGIHFNGVLYASGNITLSGDIKFFGAIVTEGTIVPSSSGSRLEVWYDHDLGQGLYRGLPVVYRAPGTWSVTY